jgi:CMP-N,N'-diacetyllegionaminic acid synthase
MRVLGLIPARGGSRGVSHKNIRVLAGRPLLQYTAEAALAAGRLNRVVLSTDDDAIAAVGKQCGLDVPFLRPAELARDTTPTLSVVRHALTSLEAAGDRFDAVCLLQPTTPFRGEGEIDMCVTLLERTLADAVMTVRRVPDEYNPHWTYTRDLNGCLRLVTGETVPIARRQDLPPVFHRDGSVYVTRRDVVLERDTLYGDRLLGYVIERGPWVNIDTPADWARAEELILAGMP